MLLGFWIAGIVIGMVLLATSIFIIKGKNRITKILLIFLSFLNLFLGSRAAFIFNDKKDNLTTTEIVYVSDVSKVVINEKENLYDYILYFVWDNNSYSKKVDGSVVKSIYKDGSFQKCEIEKTGWEVVSEDNGYKTTTVTEDK